MVLSTRIFGLATRKTLGTMLAKVLNKSSEISCGSKSCKVLKELKIKLYKLNALARNKINIHLIYLNSAPPQEADSIIKPFAHLNTNSALRIHH